MNEIQNEKEVCKYLQLPSLPKKEWDGQSLFERGVAVADLRGGGQAYVVVSHLQENKSPNVTKVFSSFAFTRIHTIRPVPQYLESVDIENADMDEDSKESLRLLADESEELESDEELSKDGDDGEETANEYFFDNITNDDEAAAFIKAYNKKNGIKARVPQNHQGLIMRLSVIYSETGGEF